MLKNLKKVISTIAAVAMLASSVAAFAVDFPDVDESASYAGAVELLTGLGIVDGDDNGKFNPDNTVTRAEFAKMVVEAKGKGDVAASSTYTKFADAQGHWAAGYIEAGVGDGFINGYDENTFGPNDTVTYAQAVKMLVAAVGYGPWAEEVGGWPAGYLAYGSTLKIVNGVTGVTNDTALTRAQCAVLIANAVKAPLLEIKSYEYVGTMNGTILVPVYGQCDNEHYFWKSLLTEYHNAYEVFGRVTATSKNGAKKGEVMYAVENSENIDGIYVENGKFGEGKDEAEYAASGVLINDTAAEDLLFEYTSAVIVKDDDTDEFSFVTIEKYGKSEMAEVDAKAVVKEGEEAITLDNLYALKSEASSATKNYKLSGAPDFYVNGFKLADTKEGDKVTESALEKAKKFLGDANQTGTVTLIDKTKVGSTLTDGKYDLVMINYTESYIVDYTRTKADGTCEVFTNAGKITWNSEDEDVTVTFTKGDEEVAFEDLAEDDVITVTMNPADSTALKGSLENIESLSAVVTNDTVSGVVSRYGDGEIVVDGAEYDVLANAFKKDENPVTKEYTLFLDANGAVVKAELVAANVNYGIITKMRWVEADDAYRVYLITPDATVTSYEVKDAEDVATKLGASKNADSKYTWTIAKKDIVKATVQYKLSSGKFVWDKSATKMNETTSALEFRASTSKLAGYSIDDATTKILDISAMIKGDAINLDEDAAKLTVESFVDEFTYDAYIFDKNTNGSYQFVVVTDGVNSLRATSPMAMVKQHTGATVVADEDVQEYIVLRNGEEATLYVAEAKASLTEGDIVMYPVTAKGYVEVEKVKVIFDASAETVDTYDEMFALAIGGTAIADKFTFEANIKKLTGGSSTDLKLYTGIAYESSNDDLAIFTSVASSKAEIAKTTDLSVADANKYTYNFNLKSGKGYRADIGGAFQTSSIFNNIDDEDSNIIDFAKAKADDVYPVLVFAREYKNDVTDVFYYIFD